MPIRSLVWSFALFVALSAASAAERTADLDAQKLIDACWAMSKDDRDSGATPRMRNGALNSVRCLEDVIADQAKMFRLYPYETRENLEKIRFGLGRLYWALYNEHPGCDPSCGRFFQGMDLPPTARVLEEIIRAMVHQRQEYGF